MIAAEGPEKLFFQRRLGFTLDLNGIGIIALVGMQDRGLGHLLQKQLANRAI